MADSICKKSGGETTGMFSKLVFGFSFHSYRFERSDLLGTCKMDLLRPWCESVQMPASAHGSGAVIPVSRA